MVHYLKGFRTYIAAAALIFVAGLHAKGYIPADLAHFLELAIAGGGLAALRAALPK